MNRRRLRFIGATLLLGTVVAAPSCREEAIPGAGAERVPGAVVITDSGGMEWRRNDGTLTDQPNQIETVHVTYQITAGEWSLTMRVHPWADLAALKAEVT